MPPARFEAATPTRERPQGHALNCTATGIRNENTTYVVDTGIRNENTTYVVDKLNNNYFQ
jgi:hypothetical protein